MYSALGKVIGVTVTIQHLRISLLIKVLLVAKVNTIAKYVTYKYPPSQPGYVAK